MLGGARPSASQLGNSGSSSGPHLRFQLMNRLSALASDGLPYVFDQFHFAGRISQLDASLESATNAGKPIPVNRMSAGARLGESRSVVSPSASGRVERYRLSRSR